MSLFRQTNEFYYLCGIEVPHSYLVLDGVTGRSTLYLPHRDAMEVHDGPRLAAEDAEKAVELTGVDAVASTETMSLDLQRFVLKRGAFECYTPFAPCEQGGTRDQLLRARGSRPPTGGPSRQQGGPPRRAAAKALSHLAGKRPHARARPAPPHQVRAGGRLVAQGGTALRTGNNRSHALERPRRERVRARRPRRFLLRSRRCSG